MFERASIGIGTILLGLLLFGHGAIHVMGFIKGFGIAAIPQLQTPISRGFALLWLLAAIAFTVTSALLMLGVRAWWLAGVVAVVSSQLAIFAAFRDARWGTLVNVIVLVPIALAAVQQRAGSFRSVYAREVGVGLSLRSAPALLSEADLQHLPSPVQRYVRNSGAVGRPRVTDYRVRFSGSIRSTPDGPFMPFEAVQHSFVEPTRRLFLLRARRGGVPFEALHMYREEQATMQVAVAALIPLFEAKGPRMDRSETVTVLNDMCVLAPATLIDPRIRWQPVDDHAAGVTFQTGRHSVSAMLSFNDAGELVNFVSHDRDQTSDGKTYANYPWSTPLHAYRDYDGTRIASGGDAIWSMPGGALTYGRFDLQSVEYNVAFPGVPMTRTAGEDRAFETLHTDTTIALGWLQGRQK